MVFGEQEGSFDPDLKNVQDEVDRAFPGDESEEDIFGDVADEEPEQDSREPGSAGIETEE